MKRPDISRRNRHRQSRSWGLINLKVVAGAIVIASLLLMTTLALLMVSRPPRRNPGPATAVLTLIAANTATPSAPTLAPGEQPGEETSVPTPPPGVVAIGAHVQVVGTGGDGLRLRDQPGLAGTVLMLGSEAEVFRIEDGPQEIDGYTWWKLVGPFDPSRGGWAVVNYLEVVQNPE